MAALWTGLAGAPLIWSLQEIAGYALAAHACFPGAAPRVVPSFGHLWLVELGLSAVALAGGAAVLLLAVRNFRTLARSGPSAHRDRARFMAVSGVLVSATFLFNIVMNGLPLFMVRPCS